MAIFFNDTRRSIRIKENKKIDWQLKDSASKGSGRIRNISKTGMLLETKSLKEPDGDFVIFNPSHKTDYIPEKGRLMWRKKKNYSRNRWLYGVQFDNPSTTKVAGLQERIQKGLISQETIFKTEKIVNALVIPAVAALLGYVLFMSIEVYRNIRTSNQRMLDSFAEHSYLTRNYSLMYKDLQTRYYDLSSEMSGVKDELVTTKDLYQESEIILMNVNKDLTSTKSILTKTELMLLQAKTNNAKLSGDLNGLKKINDERLTEMTRIKNELGTSIVALQEKNVRLNNEMERIQDRLSYYDGNVKNMEESEALLTMYHGKMKLVKLKIKQFKQEARLVHIAARKESDRMRLLIGNNGYLVRDGKTVVVDSEKYNNLIFGQPQQTAATSTDDKSVKINVNFVE
ncbi:MAG: PilZ domain-containing protein [Candidatus Omnitrophica bacterium]|nr:PilZ domain-containing protein [Candidatus Omnitrophota bacterium]